jgi:drug/metabolite transporter (DMT)-like permease
MRAFPKLVIVSLLLVYLVWGSTFLATHTALGSFPPFLLIGTRFLVAGALMFAWLKALGRPTPSWRQWRDAGLAGSLLMTGGMGLTALAQHYVSSGLTAVFIASSPLMFAVWNGLFGEWPGSREWCGILLGFAGAALLASGSHFSAEPVGVIALAGAVCCWTLGSVLSKKKLSLAPGAMGIASQMLLGGLCATLLALAKGEAFVMPLSTQSMLAWGYLVSMGSIVAFSAYIYLLRNVSPALASSYTYVNPVIAVLLGVAWAGETVGSREAMAMAIILGSVGFLLTAANTPRKNQLLQAGKAINKEARA